MTADNENSIWLSSKFSPDVQTMFRENFGSFILKQKYENQSCIITHIQDFLRVGSCVEQGEKEDRENAHWTQILRIRLQRERTFNTTWCRAALTSMSKTMGFGHAKGFKVF